jgi:hypothetical protein
MIQRLAACAVVALALLSETTVLYGASVAYEWSGVLMRDGEEDPLRIGEGWVPFRWKAVVSSGDIDIDDYRVDLATFIDAEATLWVDGFASPLQSLTATVEVYDNYPSWSPLFDMIFAGGDFEYEGAVFGLSTAVNFPFSTYGFRALAEAPPVFESTNVESQGTVGSSPYLTRVFPGASLTATLVVPEPSAAVIVCLAACGVLTAHSSRSPNATSLNETIISIE